MISRRALRQLFEGRTQEAMRHGTDTDGYRRGCLKFVQDIHESFGVTFDAGSGRPGVPYSPEGLPYKEPGTAHAKEVSLRHLAEAIMGHDFIEEYYHPAAGMDFSSRALLEAAIDPTAFLNINTFNLSVAGLINAEIMERFSNPDYIGVKLVEIKPTSQNGHKRIAAARITPPSKASKGRLPGEMHEEIGFGEMYQSTPETVEAALKIPVTREAVYFDLTGQVIETAGQVGDELGYGQDRDIAGTVLGATGLASRYNFNGTTYETYQGSSPWINTQSNAATFGSFDYTNVDKARQLFFAMTDPVTGREINVIGKDILVNPYKELLMRSQLYSADIQIGSQNTAGNFPAWWQKAGNELAKLGASFGQTGPYNVIPMTPIWYNILTAASTASYPGLGLSAGNAQVYWYIGDFKKAFMWQENWPLTPWQASADELTMKDRGLIAVYGANYRGSAFVKEPRYVVQNTN